MSERCAQPLYGRPGASTVICPACGAEHDVADQRAAMLDDLDSRLVTAAEAADLLAYLGVEGGRERVRKRINAWSTRGLLAPHSHGPDGPRYRFRDVRDRLEPERVAG